MTFSYKPLAKTTIQRKGKKINMAVPKLVTNVLFCELIGVNAVVFMEKYKADIPRDELTDLIKFREGLRWYVNLLREKKEEHIQRTKDLKEELLLQRVRHTKAKADIQVFELNKVKSEAISVLKVRSIVGDRFSRIKEFFLDLPTVVYKELEQKPASFIKSHLNQKIQEFLSKYKDIEEIIVNAR